MELEKLIAEDAMGLAKLEDMFNQIEVSNVVNAEALEKCSAQFVMAQVKLKQRISSYYNCY